MSPKNKVLSSINAPGSCAGGENRCVDIFQRPDGTFGFEEYRRDSEDGRGWFPVGFFAGLIFDSAEAALGEARMRVIWLGDVTEDDAG